MRRKKRRRTRYFPKGTMPKKTPKVGLSVHLIGQKKILRENSTMLYFPLETSLEDICFTLNNNYTKYGYTKKDFQDFLYRRKEGIFEII